MQCSDFDMSRRAFLGAMSGFALTAILRPSDLLAETRWVDSWGHKDEGEAPPPEMAKPTWGSKIIPPTVGAPVAGPYCEGRLRLKSAIHGEERDFRFRDGRGNYDAKEVAALNWFMRCRDNTWQYMDYKIIESINYLSKLLGDPLIQLNSGYRSPQYNAKLARKQEGVARNSLHQYGQAIDISIPGVSVRDVCSYALYARNTMGYGGVGYYPRSGFIHLDSGAAKEWRRS